MAALFARRLDGTLIELDLSDVKTVAEVRGRIAHALGQPLSRVKLLVNGQIISDTNELSDLGAECTAVISIPNTYKGKVVEKIAGSAVYGFRSVVYFVDGTEERSDKYETYFPLIEELNFVTYKGHDNDRYFGGEVFEALPLEHDPTEFEEVSSGYFSGWKRKARANDLRVV